MERTMIHQVRGRETKDGAGVKLVRVLGPQTVKLFDPILMLDAFDSTEPSDYTAGFPMHPHRGIETVSYVAQGKMMHRDSLGMSDTVESGEVQWMTAGSGILHEERLPAVDRMLGVQLWLNLPQSEKMTAPTYRAVKNADIPEIPLEGGKLRLLAGEYLAHKGAQGAHLPLDYYDIHLEAGASLRIDTAATRSVMVFTLLGEAVIAGERVAEKTAVKLSEGDVLSVAATADGPAEILFMSSEALNEPVAWGGPIVMNREEELRQAYFELDEETFIR